jgi:hypothetical protein
MQCHWHLKDKDTWQTERIATHASNHYTHTKGGGCLVSIGERQHQHMKKLEKNRFKVVRGDDGSRNNEMK